MGQATQHQDLTQIRQQLARVEGDSIWRSLDELSQTQDFRESLFQEFPSGASVWDDGLSRRNFLRVMGASIALAGLYGCEHKTDTKIVPYVSPPELLVPGKPLYFATAHTMGGIARGTLVESNEGRPTKVDGNPDHPADLGGSDVFMQASVLGLYDPDRSQVVTRSGSVSSWAIFASAIQDRLASKRESGGEGVRLLTGATTSPTLASLIAEFSKQYPRARWHTHEPAGRVDASNPQPIYSFDKADVIVSLDADFLFTESASPRYARDFAGRRRVRGGQMEMSRLYVIESTFSITGSMADHRLAIRPSELEPLAEMLVRATSGESAAPAESSGSEKFLRVVAEDLLAAKKRGAATLVIAGPWASPAVQAAARKINQALGSEGKTVRYSAPAETQGAASLAELTEDLRSGKADTLLILGANPAYTAPVELDFAKTLAKFSNDGAPSSYKNFSAQVGLYGAREDETAFVCQWNVPQSHDLEAWGDATAADGTVSIIQPLISPLYATHSFIEVMEAALGRPERDGYEAVRGYWSGELGLSVPASAPTSQPTDSAGAGDEATAAAEKFKKWWESSLKKGIVSGLPAKEAPASQSQPTAAPTSVPASSPDSLEVVFRPDYSVWDGSYANNGWLQELPKPLTKLTWDNAVLVGFKLAEQRGLSDGDVVRLTFKDRAIEAPITVLPGIPDGTITLTLGYGRHRVGQVGYNVEDGKPRGYNAYALRTSDALWWGAGLMLEKTEKSHKLAFTRSHNGMLPLTGVANDKFHAVADASEERERIEMENRRLIRTATLEELKADPNVIWNKLGDESESRPRKQSLTLYKPEQWDYAKAPHKWGMSIDLQSCIGCNACVSACQSENNIPVVGKEAVEKQREMHWIRIDDYFAGTVDEPAVYHQPVNCMQCENAPCELVCPVGATTHSSEGLNEMTYNRCVGTRYCSNNCPYKVRRFNFFNYQDERPSLALQRNPEVTVRSRGVMEKCTYCVQRITRTRIDIEKVQVQLEEMIARAATPQEADQIRATLAEQSQAALDDLQTACQQACPAQAIIFGDMNDVSSHGGKGSLVLQAKAETLDYPLLAELTTNPRTTYMARIRNLNPALVSEKRGKA